MRRPVVVAGVVVAVAAAGTTVYAVTRDEGDRFADYCALVEERQPALSEALSGGARTGLITALPVFRELAAAAPDDIVDEWKVVVDRIDGLADALDAAGVDAAAYDRRDPPAGVDADERAAIDAAAAALGEPAMTEALSGVEQQARDVCRVPLYV
jgi:hypothetical protein